MFKSLFLGNSRTASGPDGRRVYAIGDIHGCAGLLDKLLDAIEMDARSAPAYQLIFLGDYIDRGPDSYAVIARLIELKSAKPDTIFLKGNHEAAMLDFYSSPGDLTGWLDWGGEETLKSYGVSSVLGRVAFDIQEEINEKTPRVHLDFLNSLALMHDAGDYLFVHAGLRPGKALSEQTEEDLLWIRQPFHNMTREQRPDQVVVHGHHPVKKATDYGWRINVDSGAVWSDVLSAVVIEGHERRFIST